MIDARPLIHFSPHPNSSSSQLFQDQVYLLLTAVSSTRCRFGSVGTLSFSFPLIDFGALCSIHFTTVLSPLFVFCPIPFDF
jgi:hypothetical protein